jgi:hypothetical protein
MNPSWMLSSCRRPPSLQKHPTPLSSHTGRGGSTLGAAFGARRGRLNCQTIESDGRCLGGFFFERDGRCRRFFLLSVTDVAARAA